jgi:hypothetical protein
MLLLTEQPSTQLSLLALSNLLTIPLCAYCAYRHADFRWAGAYLLGESLCMLAVEVYLFSNRSLPLPVDWAMIAVVGLMVAVYALVTVRLIYLGAKKVCFNLGSFLKRRGGKAVKKDTMSSMNYSKINNFKARGISK